MYYEFIELVPFAAVRDELFGDEQFLELQWYLCRRPEAGDVLPEQAVAVNFAGKSRVRANATVRG